MGFIANPCPILPPYKINDFNQNMKKPAPEKPGRVKGLRPKDPSPKNSGTKNKVLITCEDGRRVEGIPAVDEPAVAPAPPVTTPAKVTHEQVAISVAVDSAPEEDIFSFPFFWDKLRVIQQIIQNIGVENFFALELLAKLISLDSTTFLVLTQVQFYFRDIEFELTESSIMELHWPSLRDEWNSRTVNEILDHLDFGLAPDDRKHLG